MEKIDILLEKSCYIMDFLPERVEPDNGGQFFDVEYYLLNSNQYVALKDRFVAVILKLMCYYESPPPNRRHKFRYAKCARQTFILRWCVRCRAHEGLLSYSCLVE